MKQVDPNKVGDVVNIYDDWENELSLMGSAKLRELHKTGRSFILKETLPEIEQIVYNYNEWLVD